MFSCVSNLAAMGSMAQDGGPKPNCPRNSLAPFGQFLPNDSINVPSAG